MDGKMEDKMNSLLKERNQVSEEKERRWRREEGGEAQGRLSEFSLGWEMVLSRAVGEWQPAFF